MVLSRDEVKSLAVSKRLIQPFTDECMGPCSYDLTFGGEYVCHQEGDEDGFLVKELLQQEKLRIPPNGCAFLLTNEVVSMPRNLMGQVALRFGLTKLGIMLSPQAPIDPGYTGKVLMMLYNLSDKPQYLGRGDPFVTIAFHELGMATAPYRGPNQGSTTISAFFPGQNDAIKTSISNTEQLVEGRTRDIEDRMAAFAENNGRNATRALTVIGVVLAAATLIAALLTVYATIAPKDSAPSSSTPSGTVPASSSLSPSSGVIGTQSAVVSSRPASQGKP